MGARLEHPGPSAILTRHRRDVLRDLGLCVNGEKHGPRVPGKGGRCQACADARSAARMRERPWERTS